MHFEEDQLYHIYNNGNNYRKIFYIDKHYWHFLSKVEKYLVPNCEILNWSLLPREFHFLVRTNQKSIRYVKNAVLPIQQLSEALRLLLSNYAQGINRQMNFTGNLFQQKTKAKYLGNDISDCHTAFHYIHQLPLTTGFIEKIEDWKFSSFPDYLDLGRETICNRNLAFDLLGLNMITLYYNSYKYLPDYKIERIFCRSRRIIA